MAECYYTREQRLRYLTFWLNDLADNIESFFKHNKPQICEDTFLTEAELCDLLHINKRTLCRYKNSGKLPYYKIGGKMLYRESEINMILQNNRYDAYNSG